MRCQVDPGMTKCRACCRRSSVCLPINFPPLTDAQQALATGPPLERARESGIPIDSPFDSLTGLPTSDLRTPETNTLLPPLLQHFTTSFDPDHTAADPFSSLLCFSLPRSLVSCPGMLLPSTLNSTSDPRRFIAVFNILTRR